MAIWKIVLPILSALVSFLPALIVIVGGVIFARTVVGRKASRTKPWIASH